MIISIELISAFIIIVGSLLTVDIYIHREAAPISIRNATIWSAIYIIAALFFAGLVWIIAGESSAILFLSGYSLEKILAIDNLLVFMVIFTYFGVQPKYQHKILHWGILGAVLFRLIFVAVGTGSLWLFGPIAETVFAFLIIYTAFIIWRSGEEDTETDYNTVWYIRLTRAILPITHETNEGKFFIEGKATPLFICLIAIEVSDVLFAFDSVPAIIAVTKDPFLIFSAMIFAILGLRSLYFVVDALKRDLVHVEKGIIVLLLLFAANLLSGTWLGLSVPPIVGLLTIITILGVSVLASILSNKIAREDDVK